MMLFSWGREEIFPFSPSERHEPWTQEEENLTSCLNFLSSQEQSQVVQPSRRSSLDCREADCLVFTALLLNIIAQALGLNRFIWHC